MTPAYIAVHYTYFLCSYSYPNISCFRGHQDIKEPEEKKGKLASLDPKALLDQKESKENTDSLDLWDQRVIG